MEWATSTLWAVAREEALSVRRRLLERETLPCAAPSGYTGSELGETANLKANTFASFGESPTNVAPRVFSSGRSSLRVVVPTGSTLGLWVLVVDAAPCDVCLGYVRKFAGYSDSGR